MKRRILVVPFLLILITGGYLFYLNKRIEGVWVVNYFSDDINKSWRSLGASVWNIENQYISSYSSGNLSDESSGSYFDIGIDFIWNLGDMANGIDYSIGRVQGDSLVLRMSGPVEREVILKRIPDTLKNNSDWKKKLFGKAFKCKVSGDFSLSMLSPYPKSNDTIYFDNGYIRHKVGNGKVSSWSSIEWELGKIKEFNIIFAKNWATLILRDFNDRIEFHGFDLNGRKYKYELNQINLDTSELRDFVILK